MAKSRNDCYIQIDCKGTRIEVRVIVQAGSSVVYLDRLARMTIGEGTLACSRPAYLAKWNLHHVEQL